VFEGEGVFIVKKEDGEEPSKVRNIPINQLNRNFVLTVQFVHH